MCMHASATCSILQPTEQIRASTAPLVKQLLEGCSERSHQPEFWGDTWDIKKVLDSVLNYTCIPLKTVMILALTTVIRYEPSENHSRGYADIRGLSYLPTGIGAKNARPNHPYGTTIILRRAEDECLCQ